MTTCSNCAKWVRERRRRYSDGTEISYYQAPEGKGHCDLLNFDTTPEFGCNQFEEHSKSYTFSKCTVIEHIDGTPWERWTDIPCPECEGKGSRNDRACHACEGTGTVRRYDDGHITKWDHPLEKERRKAHTAAEHRRALEGTTLKPLPRKDDGPIGVVYPDIAQ